MTIPYFTPKVEEFFGTLTSEARCVELARRYPGISIRQVARRVGIPHAHAMRILSAHRLTRFISRFAADDAIVDSNADIEDRRVLFPRGKRRLGGYDTALIGVLIENGTPTWVEMAILVDHLTLWAEGTVLWDDANPVAFLTKAAAHHMHFGVLLGDARPSNARVSRWAADWGAYFLTSNRRGIWNNTRTERVIFSVKRALGCVGRDRLKTRASIDAAVQESIHIHNHSPRENGAPAPCEVESWPDEFDIDAIRRLCHARGYRDPSLTPITTPAEVRNAEVPAEEVWGYIASDRAHSDPQTQLAYKVRGRRDGFYWVVRTGG